MQLKILAASIPVRQVIGPLDRTVESIAYDSRRVQRNGLFVALRGEKTDGHQFIDQAIERGASVIVTEREEKQPRVTCLVVDDTRSAMADLARPFYGFPATRLKMAAVTGTNGKTTTTFPDQTHLREGRSALRFDRDGALRNRRARFAGHADDAGVARSSGIARANRQRRLQSRGHGSFFACARAGTHARPGMGRRCLHQSHAGPSRFSRHDGKLLRIEGEIVHATRAAEEKTKTGRDREHRRSLRRATPRQDRQEHFRGHFRNGTSARIFAPRIIGWNLAALLISSMPAAKVISSACR